MPANAADQSAHGTYAQGIGAVLNIPTHFSASGRTLNRSFGQPLFDWSFAHERVAVHLRATAGRSGFKSPAADPEVVVPAEPWSPARLCWSAVLLRTPVLAKSVHQSSAGR